MGLFSRSNSNNQLAQLRDDETKAATISRRNADTAAATGKTVHGVDANGWQQRAETFQAAANGYQQQLDGK
ncbi:hypothetical protein OOK27_05710 [Streptomyces canus]|uniref:hypothetical protein n=1 Tax=Streptomyces canus TaxID=58343 RepID=UPI00224C7CE7|nr:hypothetical protein [Streptomyces canus]MCX5253671.1 hypothetical protein [Streptomyces canus]